MVRECPDCASTNVVYSEVRDQLICHDCGLIFEEFEPIRMTTPQVREAARAEVTGPLPTKKAKKAKKAVKKAKKAKKAVKKAKKKAKKSKKTVKKAKKKAKKAKKAVKKAKKAAKKSKKKRL